MTLPLEKMHLTLRVFNINRFLNRMKTRDWWNICWSWTVDSSKSLTWIENAILALKKDLKHISDGWIFPIGKRGKKEPLSIRLLFLCSEWQKIWWEKVLFLYKLQWYSCSFKQKEILLGCSKTLKKTLKNIAWFFFFSSLLTPFFFFSQLII